MKYITLMNQMKIQLVRNFYQFKEKEHTINFILKVALVISMKLTMIKSCPTWKNSPKGKILKSKVVKNKIEKKNRKK